MGLELQYVEGQSPIDEEEKDGLLNKTISTRGQLDEFEQINVGKAVVAGEEVLSRYDAQRTIRQGITQADVRRGVGMGR